MKELKHKKFANGVVYAVETDNGYPIEVTDTFLPYYTKDAIGNKQNALKKNELGDRSERWMIGVSTMSGCPVGCKFCATGKLKKCKNLPWYDIVDQVKFVIDQHKDGYALLEKAKEFKINYTRMGEPFLNIDAVKTAVHYMDNYLGYCYKRKPHHYLSTIGIKGSDFSWIKDNITLQFSIHSFNEEYRDWLIPYKNKMTLEEIAAVRTKSNLKTTLNLTLARAEDFDIKKLKDLFDPKYFFIKLSPINPNEVSEKNEMGAGVISQVNLV
jgi:adenine C2-methylase RlmN of 23S rRNA A2503 and tRNA A37